MTFFKKRILYTFGFIFIILPVIVISFNLKNISIWLFNKAFSEFLNRPKKERVFSQEKFDFYKIYLDEAENINSQLNKIYTDTEKRPSFESLIRYYESDKITREQLIDIDIDRKGILPEFNSHKKISFNNGSIYKNNRFIGSSTYIDKAFSYKIKRDMIFNNIQNAETNLRKYAYYNKFINSTNEYPDNISTLYYKLLLQHLFINYYKKNINLQEILDELIQEHINDNILHLQKEKESLSEYLQKYSNNHLTDINYNLSYIKKTQKQLYRNLASIIDKRSFNHFINDNISYPYKVLKLSLIQIFFPEHSEFNSSCNNIIKANNIFIVLYKTGNGLEKLKKIQKNSEDYEFFKILLDYRIESIINDYMFKSAFEFEKKINLNPKDPYNPKNSLKILDTFNEILFISCGEDKIYNMHTKQKNSKNGDIIFKIFK